MTSANSNEEYAALIRDQIISVASGMLSGQIPFIDGAIKLASLRHEIAINGFDSDFMPFVAIASETDHLPIGKSREFWSQEALAKHQVEIEAATRWAKQIGTDACHTIIKRFST